MTNISVGFVALQHQYMERVAQHGLAFNVLVVGPPGIGKTTLIKSLLNCRDYHDKPDHNSENKDLSFHTYRPQNKASIELMLTVIETKRFNYQLDKSNDHRALVDYIDSQFEKYLREELKVQRTMYRGAQDTRIHCCIYLLAPTGHGLKSIDLMTMKQLHERVCLIPVIAKSDVLTKTERQEFKERVMKDIYQNDIRIYDKSGDKIKSQMPLAVSASEEVFDDNGKKIRVRTYPWGQLRIEQHSEFCELRDLVLKGMITLIHETHQKYRREVTSEDQSIRQYRKDKSHFESERGDLMLQIDHLEKKLCSLRNKRAYVTSAISN